jgi:hypothetical protein
MKGLKNVLRNWKTSLIGSGALVAAATAYTANPKDLTTPIMLIVMGLLGLASKDSNVTGNGEKPRQY